MALQLVTKENVWETAQQFISKGFRVVPVSTTNDGKMRPKKPYAHGETYTDEEHYTAAPGFAVVLDRTILIDYDGNKPGANPISFDELKTVLPAGLDADCPMQVNQAGTSRHYITRIPESVDMHTLRSNNQSLIASGVDVLCGVQLVFIKAGKQLDIDRIDDMPMAAHELLERLQTSEIVQPSDDFAFFRTDEQCAAKAAEITELLTYVSADCERGQWTQVVFAVATELTSAPELAIKLLEDWSMTGGDKYDAIQTPIQIRQYVQRNNPSRGISMSTLAYLARGGGANLSEIAIEHQLIEEAMPDSELRHTLDRFALVACNGRYWDMDKHMEIYPSTLETMFRHVHPGTRGQPLLTTLLARDPHKRIVDYVGFMPVNQPFFEMGRHVFANTYQPPELPVIRGDVEPWLKIVRHVYGEHYELVLDHLAFTVQYPEKKIMWQIFLYGAPRTGKTLSLMPMQHIFGMHTKIVEGAHADLIYDDAYQNAKVVIFEEVAHKGKKGVYESLKTKLANDGMHTLNIKGRNMVMQPNCYSIYLFSNNSDALAIDENGDKLLVLKGPDEPLPESDYEHFGQLLARGTIAPFIHHYLLNRDVSSFPRTRLPIRTQAVLDMSQAAAPEGEQVLREWLEDERTPFMRPDIGPHDLRVLGVRIPDIRNVMRQEGLFSKTLSARGVLERARMKKITATPLKYGRCTTLFVESGAAVHSLGELARFDWVVRYMLINGRKGDMLRGMLKYADDHHLTEKSVVVDSAELLE